MEKSPLHWMNHDYVCVRVCLFDGVQNSSLISFSWMNKIAQKHDAARVFHFSKVQMLTRNNFVAVLF